MKKLLVLILALVTVFAFTACGGDQPESSSKGGNQNQSSSSTQNTDTAPQDATTDETTLGKSVTYSVDGEDLLLKIKTSYEFDAKSSRIAIVNKGVYLKRDSQFITQCLFDESCFDEEFDNDWFNGTYVFKVDSRLTDIASSAEWAPGTWTMMLYEDESKFTIGQWNLVLEGGGKYHFEFKDAWLKGAGEDKKVKEFESLAKEVASWFTYREYSEDWAEFLFDGYYLEETDPNGYDKYYLMVCPEGDYATYEEAGEVDISYADIREKCPYLFSIEQGGIANGKYTMVLAKMGGNVEIQFGVEKVSATKWTFDFANAKCPALSSKYAK